VNWRLLILTFAVPLVAQIPEVGHWTLGVQRLGPDLSGKVFNQNGSLVSTFDIDKDLALQKDSTSVGFMGEYEGRRFLLNISSGGQTYVGHNVLTTTVSVNGTSYATGTNLTSHIKIATADLTWVIKLVRWDHAYVGLDLGVNAWKLDVDATGVTGSTTQTASDQLSVPIPQIGASVGGHFPGGFLDVRGSYHLLKKGDAKYHRTLLEARAYPLRWLGVRVFHEDERIDVPKGSLSDDFSLNLDRQGTGFGVLFRF
jgi:hypothetical protein